MDKFLYMDSDKNLYDEKMREVKRYNYNTYELIIKYGFNKKDLIFNKKAIGMRFIGANMKYRYSNVFIKIPDSNIKNIYFKEEVKAVYTSDNNKWIKFYDKEVNNQAVENININNMEISELNSKEKKDYDILNNIVTRTKMVNNVNNLDFKFIFLKLEKDQNIDTIYEKITLTNNHSKRINPEIFIDVNNISIKTKDNTKFLKVSITKSSDKIKNTLKEF